MARPYNARAAADARFVYRWWRLTFRLGCVILWLVCLNVVLNIVLLRNQHGHLNSSLTTTVTANSSGESPDPGVGCATCYLGQDRCWAGLCQDLLKARKNAEDYFHSQVMMRVQHRLPMDNGTLYDQLQSLKAEALYRFRNQTGNKDVTGHVWDEMEVDMEKTILDLLHLNLYITAKENNTKDRQVAAVKVESDCDNITDSEVKVVCLKTRMKMLQSQVREGKVRIEILKERLELEQRKQEKGKKMVIRKVKAPQLMLVRSVSHDGKVEMKLKRVLRTVGTVNVVLTSKRQKRFHT